MEPGRRYVLVLRRGPEAPVSGGATRPRVVALAGGAVRPSAGETGRFAPMPASAFRRGVRAAVLHPSPAATSQAPRVEVPPIAVGQVLNPARRVGPDNVTIVQVTAFPGADVTGEPDDLAVVAQGLGRAFETPGHARGLPEPCRPSPAAWSDRRSV